MSAPDMPNRRLIIVTAVVGIAALGAFSAVAPEDLGTHDGATIGQHSQATTR